MAVRKLISGGQTGADRAALDVAIELGIDHGGWVIKGRRDEHNRIIDNVYNNLREADNEDPNQRTEWNVWDSDATLILSHGPLEQSVSPGSAWTMNRAVRFGKPVLLVDFKKWPMHQAAQNVQRWLQSNSVRTLNVAGPRESEDTQIYQSTRELLTEVLTKQPLPLPEQAFEVAAKIYEQTYANFRHWDQIRWLVPYWFATLSGGVAAVLGLVSKEREPFVRLGLVGFGIFAFLCIYLLYKLIIYHIHSLEALEESLSTLLGRSAVKDAMTKPLPFSFKLERITGTATIWFMLYIFAIGLLSLVLAAVGLFWLA
jgi:putative molybdenum carrier protein